MQNVNEGYSNNIDFPSALDNLIDFRTHSNSTKIDSVVTSPTLKLPTLILVTAEGEIDLWATSSALYNNYPLDPYTGLFYSLDEAVNSGQIKPISILGTGIMAVDQFGNRVLSTVGQILPENPKINTFVENYRIQEVEVIYIETNQQPIHQDP